LNPDLNPGVTSVGIRIPAHQFIRRLANFCREPLALTSANTSNKPSTVAIEEFKELWPKLDLIVDGGTIQNPSRLGSTVVDISQPKLFTIIRSGSVYDETRHLLRDKYGLQEITSSQK
jgi:tRNA A37 threonylcarbamoyladenosine synthetase subunit TsaC/SUA5/YrdC